MSRPLSGPRPTDLMASEAPAPPSPAAPSASPGLRVHLALIAVQLIFGADDRIIPASHAAGLPGNVKVHVLPAAGHVPQMEKAGDVNKLIGSFGPAA